MVCLFVFLGIEYAFTLNPDSDYTIFTWRQQQHQSDSPRVNPNGIEHTRSVAIGEPGLSRLPVSFTAPRESSPTLYLHNPAHPLPVSPAYRNPSYYAFDATPMPKGSPAPSTAMKHGQDNHMKGDGGRDGIPKLVKQFEKFHSQNGVRTVMGSIGPVENGM